MKKAYNAPKLSVHGSVEKLTLQRQKFDGLDDGLVFTISGVDVPIGSI